MLYYDDKDYRVAELSAADGCKYRKKYNINIGAMRRMGLLNIVYINYKVEVQ